MGRARPVAGCARELEDGDDARIVDRELRVGLEVDLVQHDDLLQLVQKKRPDIGRTTVYRTLKLLLEAGLASQLDVQGQARFEHEYNRQHHDHFICNGCSEIIEFSSPEIEQLQDDIAAGLGFVIQGHRHQIYGLCQRCATRRPAADTAHR